MTVIGEKVRLIEKIASGGMGDVYRAKQLATGAEVAVKLLEPASHPDERALERFRTEVRISALLAHRSIVRVYDLLDDDGTLALVMELLVGQTLEQRLVAKKFLEPELAIAIAVAILGALDHAHAVGVVHRDVKPANIFLAVDPDGRVTPKLLDFGVAQSANADANVVEPRVLGTSRYASPQQARGEALDGRSDIFSMATVIYEAITGESPFAASDTTKELANVVDLTVDPHERIPPRVWLVLQKALSKQAYARHASARVFATALVQAIAKTEEELASLLHDERPPLPKLETPDVAIRDVRKSKSKITWRAAALVLAASVAIVAVLALRRTSPPIANAGTPVPDPTTSISPPLPSLVLTTTAIVSAQSNPSTTPRVVRAPTSAALSRTKPIATTPGF